MSKVTKMGKEPQRPTWSYPETLNTSTTDVPVLEMLESTRNALELIRNDLAAHHREMLTELRLVRYETNKLRSVVERCERRYLRERRRITAED